MHLTYTPQGTCSRAIDVDIDPATHIILGVRFTGGCHGNTQGVCALARGQKAEDVIARLEGIRCKDKPTSCPDQLARALRQALH